MSDQADRPTMTQSSVRRRALTVCQPYAELIARGDKSIENRTWFTPYRGDLFIHAGKSRSWLDDDDDPSDYVFGAIVAVATIYDCVRIDRLTGVLQASEHANGPWCWLLQDVRRLKPAPCQGAQGLWFIPTTLEIAHA